MAVSSSTAASPTACLPSNTRRRAPPRSPEGRRWERYAFGRVMYYKNFYPLPEILGTGFVNGGAFSLYLLPGAP